MESVPTVHQEDSQGQPNLKHVHVNDSLNKELTDSSPPSSEDISQLSFYQPALSFSVEKPKSDSQELSVVNESTGERTTQKSVAVSSIREVSDHSDTMIQGSEESAGLSTIVSELSERPVTQTSIDSVLTVQEQSEARAPEQSEARATEQSEESEEQVPEESEGRGSVQSVGPEAQAPEQSEEQAPEKSEARGSVQSMGPEAKASKQSEESEERVPEESEGPGSVQSVGPEAQAPEQSEESEEQVPEESEAQVSVQSMGPEARAPEQSEARAPEQSVGPETRASEQSEEPEAKKSKQSEESEERVPEQSEGRGSVQSMVPEALAPEQPEARAPEQSVGLEAQASEQIEESEEGAPEESEARGSIQSIGPEARAPEQSEEPEARALKQSEVRAPKHSEGPEAQEPEKSVEPVAQAPEQSGGPEVQAPEQSVESRVQEPEQSVESEARAPEQPKAWVSKQSEESEERAPEESEVRGSIKSIGPEAQAPEQSEEPEAQAHEQSEEPEAQAHEQPEAQVPEQSKEPEERAPKQSEVKAAEQSEGPETQAPESSEEPVAQAPEQSGGPEVQAPEQSVESEAQALEQSEGSEEQVPEQPEALVPEFFIETPTSSPLGLSDVESEVIVRTQESDVSTSIGNIRSRVHVRSLDTTEQKEPGISSPKVVEKNTLNMQPKGGIPVLALSGFIAAVVIVFYICTGQTQSSGSNNPILQTFHKNFNGLKADFPGQNEELWLRSRKLFERHLNKSQPLEPVTFILAAAKNGERTIHCLSERFGKAYADSVDATLVTIDSLSKTGLDGIATKLQIDQELSSGFESTARAAVFHRLETLPPSSLLILYKYCDHENAAFKKVALVLTVLLEEESLNTDMSLITLEEKVKDFLWDRFITSDGLASHNQMDGDKLSGVWSRISHLVLPVLPVKVIENGQCP